MLIFGGTSDTDKDIPEPCEESVAMLNLDLHEWLSIGDMSGPIPTNMIFHHTYMVDDFCKSKLKILILFTFMNYICLYS